MAIELSDSIADDRLDINPFDDGVAPGDYFVDQVRTLSFNKLVHLAPYSELLLVSGPYGVGKTALLQQFVAKAADTWRAALVQVRESDLDSDLLLKIIEHVEMPLVTTDESRGMLFDSLARFLESLGRSGRRAIIVIDDAQNLDDAQLTLLGALLSDYRADNALSLILIAPSEFAPRLQGVKELASRLTYTLELEPLSADEVEPYISRRLAMSGAAAEGRLFTPEVVEEIHLQSEGYPARINALVRKVLQTHKIERVRRPGRKAGMGRWVMVAVGVVAIALIILFQNEINQFYAASEDQPVAAVAHPPVLEQTSIDLPAPLFDPEASAAEKSDGGTQSTVAASDGVILVPAPATTDVPVKKKESPPQELLAAIKLPEQPPEQAPEKRAEAEEVVPEPEPAPATLPQAPQESVAAKEDKPALSPVLSRDQQWLLAQPASHYTLQLMALKDEKKVRHFAETNGMSGNSAIFFTTRRGNRLAVLVYGSFATQAQAKAAGVKLPRSWGVRQPWARSFASVQADFHAESQQSSL